MTREERAKRVYALYENETNICDGTLEEIHKRTGLNMKLLRWMTYPGPHKRFEAGRYKRGLVFIE
ncbi:MAG: hypothetical protein K6C05_10235 [Anaerovibrio sp.]|uniref:hypothetical protein n=1 Tax=Anaerovibrio sp. TaxID=1872532 RepID=UPI0025DDFA0E|nr:hypothetical protein [Anaerovibrio sp.]MCR5177207.1 hypothetical protein [Anaerovibrio sp.]